MAETIIDGTTFNTSEIKYSAPKALGNLGGKTINILNPTTNTGLRLSNPFDVNMGC